jgi:hypothetical protein
MRLLFACYRSRNERDQRAYRGSRTDWSRPGLRSGTARCVLANIDKAPEFPVGSRGKGLQSRSLEILDDLGVVDRIISAGTSA